MVVSAADYRKIIQIAVPLAAALLVASVSRMPAQAQTSHMLVIPASDGYDFEDCLGSASKCGQTIADAWCEAHGMSASLSYGRADDVTASVRPVAHDTAPVMKLAPGSFVVNCKE